MNDLQVDEMNQTANFATGIGQIIIGISGAIIGILRILKAVKELKVIKEKKLSNI